MDEQKAIQRLKNRDIGGLEFLVHKYQVKAVRTAYLITRDIGLAESIVQDCFIQAYRSIRGFDATRPFEPWFLLSVVNAAVKMMQRSARQVEVGLRWTESYWRNWPRESNRSSPRWSLLKFNVKYGTR